MDSTIVHRGKLYSKQRNECHSEKPAKFYGLVKSLGEPRIDLFARKKRSGWDCWGNEVESDIELRPTSVVSGD